MYKLYGKNGKGRNFVFTKWWYNQNSIRNLQRRIFTHHQIDFHHWGKWCGDWWTQRKTCIGSLCQWSPHSKFKSHWKWISDLSEYAGVHAEKVKDCYFENLSLEDNVYGFYLAETSNCTIKNNTSVGNAENEVLGGNGIHLWSASHNKIIGNKLKKHRDGIYLEFSEHLEIEGNESEENIRYGMHFMFSSHNQFNKNIFKNNSAGVAVMYSKDITMEEKWIFRQLGRKFQWNFTQRHCRQHSF